MLATSSRLFRIIPVVASVGVLTLGGALGVRPVLQHASTTREEVQEMRAANDTAGAQNAALRVQAEDIDELREAQARLRDRLPESPLSTRVLDEAAAAAQAAGLQLTGVSLGNPEPVDQASLSSAVQGASLADLSSMTVSLAVTGDDAGLGRFLADLADGPRVFTVTRIESTRGSEKESDSWSVSGLVWTLDPVSP